MASYWEIMQRQAKTKNLGQPMDTSPSVMDDNAKTRENLGNALELADIASNVLPGKAALAGLGGIMKYKKAMGWADDAAAEALHMMGKRKPRGDTFFDTNTYLSPDGFLRQEIPDAGAVVRNQNLASIVQQGPDKRPFIDAKMGEALDHPELYTAYPEIANMTLRVKPRPAGSQTSGTYFPAADKIELYPASDSLIEKGNIDMSDILHELQHKVQKVEQFPQRGGSVSSYRNLMEAAERAKGMKVKSDYKFDPSTGLMYKDLQQELKVRGSDPFKAYSELLGEAEARMVESRRYLSNSGRKLTHPLSNMARDVNSVTLKDPITGKWRRVMLDKPQDY